MSDFDPFAGPSFVNPWSLRVFGVTLAAAEAGVFTLKEFQKALIAQIGDFEAAGGCIDSDETYYTHWTDALTSLLEEKKLVEPTRLIPAEQAVRDVLEALWHDHDHDHGHDHEHDRAHDAATAVRRPVFVEAAR